MQNNPGKNQRFSILFEKYLKGECTEAEAQEILTLLEDPGNDRDIRSKATVIWDRCSDLKEDKTRMGSILNGLHHSINLSRERERRIWLSDKKWFQYLSRAAAILILPVLFYSLYVTTRLFSNKSIKEESAIWQTIKVSPGIQSEFILPDSSQIWLNSGSVFKFPGSFTGKVRRVELAGEGYFKIYKDTVNPFIVNTCGIDIKVKGTQFVVVGYPDESDIEVILESGNVELSRDNNKDEKPVSLTQAGEKATYDFGSNRFSVQKVDIDKYTSWKDGILIFRDDPLSTVAKRLSRKFNVDIELKGINVKDYVYTATFKNESLSQILDLLEKSAPIKYVRTEQRILKDNSYMKPKIIITQIN